MFRHQSIPELLGPTGALAQVSVHAECMVCMRMRFEACTQVRSTSWHRAQDTQGSVRCRQVTHTYMHCFLSHNLARYTQIIYFQCFKLPQHSHYSTQPQPKSLCTPALRRQAPLAVRRITEVMMHHYWCIVPPASTDSTDYRRLGEKHAGLPPEPPGVNTLLLIKARSVLPSCLCVSEAAFFECARLAKLPHAQLADTVHSFQLAPGWTAMDIYNLHRTYKFLEAGIADGASMFNGALNNKVRCRELPASPRGDVHVCMCMHDRRATAGNARA